MILVGETTLLEPSNKIEFSIYPSSSDSDNLYILLHARTTSPMKKTSIKCYFNKDTTDFNYDVSSTNISNNDYGYNNIVQGAINGDGAWVGEYSRVECNLPMYSVPGWSKILSVRTVVRHSLRQRYVIWNQTEPIFNIGFQTLDHEFAAGTMVKVFI